MRELRENECSCKKCQLFCKVMPSYLLPEDLIKYMHATGFEPESLTDEHEEGDTVTMTMQEIIPWAKENLLASDGAVVQRHDGNLMRIATLVPNNRKNGSCIHFNQKSGQCAIHAKAPFGCRYFSCSMDQESADDLSMASVTRLGHVWETLMEKPESLSTSEAMYAAIWLELDKKGHKRKRTTIALRKLFAKRMKEIEND